MCAKVTKELYPVSSVNMQASQFPGSNVVEEVEYSPVHETNCQGEERGMIDKFNCVVSVPLFCGIVSTLPIVAVVISVP